MTPYHLNYLRICSLGLLAPFLLLVAPTAPAASTIRTLVLNNTLPVWDVTAEDVNGNGLNDLITLGCDENSYPLEKSVSVFLATEIGEYPEKPVQTLELPTEMAALFFAEVDGAAPRELVAIHGRGARVYGFSEGRYTAIDEPKFFSLYPSGSKNPIILGRGAIDLDDDGIEEWLIPVPEGYEIRHGNTLIASVPCDMYSELRRGSSVYVYHRFPALLPYDIPDSKAKGLAMLSDEFADFAYGENWEQHWRFKIPVNLEEKWEASSRMEDINNDGFPDLIVTQTRGTAKLEAQTHIYLAEAPYKYPDDPSATFIAKGALVSPLIMDVDGDDTKDVMIINIPFGIKNLMNFFMRSKVSVNLDVYQFNGTGYPDDPSFHTALTMDAPEGREQVAYTMGDFNGDKRIDIAFSRTVDSLAIHFGTENSLIEERAENIVEVPSFGQARSIPLRGDAHNDIILFHPGGEQSKRVEVILVD